MSARGQRGEGFPGSLADGVGSNDPFSTAKVAELYAALNVDTCIVSLRTAEMIKYACNAFHALKVAFANEIGTIAHSLGVSGTEVMQTLCRETLLNISRVYLKPGFAFGDSCLPKNLRALVYRASRLDVSVPLLPVVLPSDESHLRRAIDAVSELPVSRLGIFGLAFKKNTDDLRESPVGKLLEHLLGKGRDVCVYDPHIQSEDIYGRNREFILKAVPHIRKVLQKSVEEMLAWADYVIVAQTVSPEYQRILETSGIPVLDLTVVDKDVAEAVSA